MLGARRGTMCVWLLVTEPFQNAIIHRQIVQGHCQIHPLAITNETIWGWVGVLSYTCVKENRSKQAESLRCLGKDT